MFFVSIFFFVLGVCIGSFLLCLCQRLAHKKNLISTSYCPECKKKLPFWMLLPLFSYIFLKGQCYYCKKKIPLCYPLAELSCGLVFVMIFITIPFSWELFYFLVVWSVFFLIALFDFQYQWFFSSFLVLLFLLRCVFLFWIPVELLESFLGLLIGAGFFYFVAFFYQFFAKKQGLGEGDISLLGILGFFFGYNNLLAIIIYSSFFGIVFGIFLLLKTKKSTPFAFTPALILAAFLHWLFPSIYTKLVLLF